MKFITVLLIFISFRAMAASCCGGGSSFPGLITGDSKAQISSRLTNENVIGKAYNEGNYEYFGDSQNWNQRTLSLKAAYLFGEYTQLGLGTKIIQKDFQTGNARDNETGLGDTELVLGHEVLKETGFSWWKPRGIGFIKLVLPTSKNNYESRSQTYADVTGKGQWTLGSGMALIKVVRNFDFQVMAQGFYRVARDVNDVEISDSYGGGFLTSIGLSPSNRSPLRFGVGISGNYESEKTIRVSGRDQKTFSEYYYDLDLNVSYQFKNQYALTVSYVDQTLLGPAQNTTISRTIGLNLIKRWSL